jgi:hypothetical protein
LQKNLGVDSTGRPMSFVPSIIALSAMAAVALVITLARGGINADPAALRSAVRTAVLAIACQVLHFAEEAGGGLNRRLPEFFGLDPVAMNSFVGVNLVALAVWVLSVVALRGRISAALFPLWFLAVASVSNALLHPALAVAARGYFPGVLTAPVVGVAGAFLLRGLGRITGDSK